MKRSCSARENSASRSPHNRSVGAVTRASPPASSVLEQPVDGQAPEARRQLQTLHNKTLEKFRWQRPMGGARLELARELDRDRIRKLAEGCLQFLRDRIGCREAGADQRQAGDSIWLCDCGTTRDEAAERVAHERGAFDGERIEEGDDIGRQIRNCIAGFGTIRVAEPALVDGEYTIVLRQERKNPAEREPRVGPAVQKDDGLAARVALFRVVKARSRREPNGGESHAVISGTPRCRERPPPL